MLDFICSGTHILMCCVLLDNASLTRYKRYFHAFYIELAPV
ncbi:hypothetical protein LPE509_00398 [Legionella pneumophila subsp. pneumophila LPE509]|nr:hypothetical protein LPE509_00398 [Legionella pneumophila subsp. pneumophila LPE509]